MARPLRLEHPGAIWHLTSRGNERRDIYRDHADRLEFLDILGQSVTLHRWIVYAWVLMSNHYHVLLETPHPTLSSGAKRLNEQYAQRFNARHSRQGHLFQGRFKSILVERESHLLELLRYIVLNPVRCGAVRYAGDYRWSSYLATAGLCAAPDWLAVTEVLAEFGSGSRTANAERYRQFVADGRGAEYKPWERLVGQVYLGGESFCARMQTLVGERRESRAYPEAQRAFVRPSLESIVVAVEDRFGESEAKLRKRSSHPARKAIAELAWREAGLSLAAIGNWLGISPQGVKHLIDRGSDLQRTDAEFAAELERVRALLQLP
ncbi:MAG: transposase [Acidobacteria bacterium]|nr:transposase [Acidobacteriota bacterium]